MGVGRCLLLALLGGLAAPAMAAGTDYAITIHYAVHPDPHHPAGSHPLNRLGPHDGVIPLVVHALDPEPFEDVQTIPASTRGDGCVVPGSASCDRPGLTGTVQVVSRAGESLLVRVSGHWSDWTNANPTGLDHTDEAFVQVVRVPATWGESVPLRPVHLSDGATLVMDVSVRPVVDVALPPPRARP